MTDFINKPTESLVNELRGLIQSRDDLRSNQGVAKAFEAFSEISKCEPAIIPYVKKVTAKNDGAALSKEQIELLMMATIFRSSSTYGTIPAIVSDLSLVSEHTAASVINENSQNEAGDKRHRPHPNLLFDNFQILGEALGIPSLTPASHSLARQIYRLRNEKNDQNYADVDGIKTYLKEKHIHVPDYTNKDIETAIHYCNLAKPEIASYHTNILRLILGMDDTGKPVDGRNPNDQTSLARQSLELAVREASSVDEHDTGKLSYIGAYGLLTDALLGHVPENKRAAVTAWTRAHNDEVAGQSVGWESAAEEGHADDARALALQVLGKLPPEKFEAVLHDVTHASQMRLDYWGSIVSQCEQWGRNSNNTVSLNHAHYEEPPSPTKTKPVQATAAISGGDFVIDVGGTQFKIVGVQGEPPQKLLEALGVDSDAAQKISSGARPAKLNIGVQHG